MLDMIVSFKNKGTEDVFDGNNTKDARKTCPINLWAVARRKLDQLNASVSLNDLRVPPGNRLEALEGNREGQHSIRINDQYRICFIWTGQGAIEVEIVDYHA
jgi:proteic killer suppression protein